MLKVLLINCLCLNALGAESSRVPLNATVLAVRGMVRSTTDGKSWDLLEAGDKLRAGTLIQTGITNAELDLQLGGASVATSTNTAATRLRLFGNSILGLKKLSLSDHSTRPMKEVELDLRSGQMQASVENGPIDCEVEFPAGVAGIRSGTGPAEATSFLMSHSGAITVFSGKAVVSLADTQSVAKVVGKGQRLDPKTREVTELPIDAPERKFESLSPLFP